MTKYKKDKYLIEKDGKKGLDISINMSHNRLLSNKRLIQLVKLLARQAAEEDFKRSHIPSDQGR